MLDIHQLSSHVSSYYRNRDLRATLSDTVLAGRPLSGRISATSGALPPQHSTPPQLSTSPSVSLYVSQVFGSQGGLRPGAKNDTVGYRQVL